MRAAPPVVETTDVPPKPLGPATAVAARTGVDIVEIVPSAKLRPAVTVTLTTAMMGEGTVTTADEVTVATGDELPSVAPGRGGEGIVEVIADSPVTVVLGRVSH